MRRVIFRALIALMAVTSLSYAFNALLLHGLQQRHTGAFGQWNRVRAGTINAEVLFTGSSRCLMHFDAQVIGERTAMRCWNLGMDGSQPMLQRPWLLTYLKYNPPPRLIVQEVGALSLRTDSSVYYASQYAPYLAEDVVYDGLLSIDPAWWYDKHIPLHSFVRFGTGFTGMAIKGLFDLEDTIDMLDHGYQSRRWKSAAGFDRFQQRWPEGSRYPITPQGTTALVSIIHIAKKAGARIVLVYAPEFLDDTLPEPNRQEVLDVYDRIAREDSILFRDFSVLPWCTDRRWFHDSQHLNSDGVARLTSLLTDSVKVWIER